MKKSDRNRIEAFEMWCWRKMLSISWQEHCTNDSILTALGLERELIGRVAKLKLQYFGHITRRSAGQLALTVLEGIMEGLRHHGRSRMNYSFGKHNLPEVYRAMMYVSVVSLTFWLLVGVSFKNYVKVLLNYLKCVMFGFVCRL